MIEPTATLDVVSEDPVDLHPTELQQPPERRAASMKFTYPSGSRPLDGYTIKRGIGQGGFGEVYYATSDAGKEVALKLIRRNLDVELRGVTQCLNLKHPNLVALYDIKVDDRGDNWVVMEYVAGESLEDTIARHPEGMPVAEALLWFHGIASGVAYLHDRGIVHRDLKPGNIFNDEGQVKIGDYGLSKFISASRRSGQTESVGTVHYMAPEIANGRYGKEIDLYALGIILYELLSGQVPFEGESVGEVLMKHLTAEPDVTRVPAEYREVVARSLAKDPERRPHSVAEFLAALPASAAPAAAPPSLEPRPRPEPAPEAVAMGGANVPPAPRIPLGIPIPPENVGRSAQAKSDPKTRLPKLAQWWHSLPAGAKVVIGVILVWMALRFLGDPLRGELNLMMRPSVVLVLVFVGIVALIRYFKKETPDRFAKSRPSNWPFSPPAAPKPVSPAPLQPAIQVRYSPRQYRQAREDVALQMLLQKPLRDRLTELVGSLLLAAVVSAAAALLLLVVQRDRFQSEYAWLALCGTLGAWGVLIPAKLWEGREGDVVLRRFVMLGIGLAFGLAAFEAGSFLRIMLPNEVDLPHVSIDARATFDEHGQPEVMGYLAYFAFLFLLVRWWRQSDPLRPSRLSLLGVFVCVFWAAVLNAFWQFPQPWGMMIAGTISLAVQLSSPWLNPQFRVARVAGAPAAVR